MAHRRKFILKAEPDYDPQQVQSETVYKSDATVDTSEFQPTVAVEKAPSQPAKNPKSSPKEIESGIQNIQKEITQKNEEVKKEYHYPPLKLLKRGDGKSQGDSDEHLANREEITGYAAQLRCQCHSDECKLWPDCYPL